MTTTLAQFNGQSLTIIEHQGRKWLTAEQAGNALGYSKDKAGDSVFKMYSRHVDEFTDADSVTVKLTATDGKAYNKRIFSETGCNKLGFFANTAMAKQFRQFAAKTLAGQGADPARMAAIESRLAELEAYKRDKDLALLSANPRWETICLLRAAGKDGVYIARVLGLTRSQQEREVKNIRAAGLGHLLPVTAKPPVGRKLAAAHAAQMSLGV